MLILGIETSCDDTAVAIVEVSNGRGLTRTGDQAKLGLAPTNTEKEVKIKVLSNIVSSQVKLHAKYGGVFPSLAAREHVKNLPRVLRLALNPKRYTLSAVDLIAVTRGPGLISSLLVGSAFAKTLAWKNNIPIVGVNHLEGHIASNWLPPITGNSKFEIRNQSTQGVECSAEHLPCKCSGSKKIQNSKFKIQNSNIFPALCLIVSGGHTQLVLMRDTGKYKLVGETLDDAAGEAFDKIARILGLGYPGGPKISALAEISQTNADWTRTNTEGGKISLPRPMINSKNFDFSFAGLKTAVLYLVRDLTKKYPLPRIRAAVAAEAQQAIVDVLVTKTIRAAKHYEAKSIMLSGGVSANKLLRLNLNKAAGSRGLKFFKPEMEYTTDNAAMIALAGYWNWTKLKNKKTANRQSLEVNSNLNFG